MADADPADFMATPLTVDQRLRERVASAVISQAGIRHDELNAFLRDHLSCTDVSRGALLAEPALEGAAGYVSSGRSPFDLRGTLLHPRVVDALIGREGQPYRFDYPAYSHQLEAWEHLLSQDRRSVLVSSGTGSGKTECFLVPMLDDLAREVDQRGRLTGVRALMLYPLNALIASQEERLRRWIAPFDGDIRFALYNGLMTDKRKDERDRAEASFPEQVLYRRTLRSDPPPVLVTNTTMLEYMTIRKEDHPIVKASQGLLRWIVIDEAHSYVGSAAAEVSLLLRRVLQTFGVKAADVRFVATSATIGGSDERAKADLQRYLADLAGVPTSQVRVVLGARQEVSLPPRGEGRSPAIQGSEFARHPVVQDFVREAEQGPLSLGRVQQMASAAGIDAASLINGVTAPGAASEGSGPLLPLRVHQFIRAVPGLWSCINSACPGEKPTGWPYGRISFQAEDQCGSCGSQLFEIVSCRECGEPWLNAFDHGDRLLPADTAPDRDEFAAASAREMDEPGSEETGDEAEDQEAPRLTDGERRLLGVRPLPDLRERRVQPLDGTLPERRGEGTMIWLSRPVNDGRCPRCHAAGSANSAGPLWPFRFGAPFLIQNSTPTMLEGVSPSAAEGIELPAEGRQLISFTDSRQGTARFAANIETMSERSFVRSFVYHLVQKASARTELPPEMRVKLEEKRDKLAMLARDDQMFASYLAEVEAQLAGQQANEDIPWSTAVKALGSEPMVRQWIGRVWDADRDDRFHRDPDALANYLLLRELARRPRRANAIETLGLARLAFPAIDKLTAASIPRRVSEGGFKLQDWQDYLYFLVDTVVRAHFVINIGWADARWLLPKKAFLRTIVGPNEAKRNASDVVWPQARAVGTKTNAVLLLERTLGLDSASGEDRATMNDVLQSAWDQVRPLLEGTGSTLSLALDKASIASVGAAWLCPVTNRVLPRLAMGRSPYGLRGAPPGSDEKPIELGFPHLPSTFPRNSVDRERLRSFTATAPEVSRLRELGVWSNLHDRAATFVPYIRAEEHSAQQPPYRLRAFEEQFKKGEINLLACSTTMEMGVDIGSIEAVLNTNVPPSIANYRQRVGRAGRRGQSFASSLTFARNTPLDREAFLDPVRYLQTGLRSPRVKLDSKRIVQRHANALLLAQWFREAAGELNRVKAGDFFGFPQSLTFDLPEEPPIAQFLAWLEQPSTAAHVRSQVDALTSGTALDAADNILFIAHEMFSSAEQSFGAQWRSLREQSKTLTAEARAGLEIQVRRMCREPLLRELANGSLLPGHGFPNAVVPFITDCAETRDRQRSRQDDEGETTRNRRYDYPSRNADVAIREYAPGAEIVVDGLVWTSAGVTLNWERPAHDNGDAEIQSIRWAWSCQDCGEAGCALTMVEQCTACASTTVDRQQFLEPAGFRVDWRAKPHAETDKVEFIEPSPARISAREARWEPLLDPDLGRVRATANGMVFHHSLGRSKQGYRICLDCGRAAEEGDTSLADHDALMPPKGGAGRCSGNDKTFAITRPLALGHEVLTDVAEFQPAHLTDVGAAWALASAMREALARLLGIEPRELGLGVARRSGALDAPTCSLFIFDQSSGGAGYAPRLLDDLTIVLRSTQQILECPLDCSRGCSSCVLVADLFAQQEIIDRRAALAFVTGLLVELSEPKPEDVPGPQAALSAPVADVLARRAGSGDVVAVFTGPAFDLTALAEPPLSTMLASLRKAGADVRLVLPIGLLDQMDDAARAGLRNASHRHGFTLWNAKAVEGSNGSALVAALRVSGSAEGFFTRDRAAAVLGSAWGAGSEHPLVTMPMSDMPAMRRIDEDKLERASTSGDRVRIIQSDPGRPVRQFGPGLVNRVLKEDLEAAGLWKPRQLKAISYSDRYLKAPLPVLLMLRTVAALRDALAPERAVIPLTITTEPLREDSYGGAPFKLQNNWKSEDDRADVIEALAGRLRFECSYQDSHAPHGRKMAIQYEDGSEALILFDQGFGYWRATSNDRHDFRARPAQQASALLEAGAFVAGMGESYVAVTKA